MNGSHRLIEKLMHRSRLGITQSAFMGSLQSFHVAPPMTIIVFPICVPEQIVRSVTRLSRKQSSGSRMYGRDLVENLPGSELLSRSVKVTCFSSHSHTVRFDGRESVTTIAAANDRKA